MTDSPFVPGDACVIHRGALVYSLRSNALWYVEHLTLCSVIAVVDTNNIISEEWMTGESTIVLMNRELVWVPFRLLTHLDAATQAPAT